MPIRTTAPRRPPRRTHITDHSGEEMYRLLYGALPTGTQLPATQRNMLGLPGAHAAVSKIANNAAHMLLEATVEGAATRPQVVSDPCTEYDPFTFWKTLLATAMCRGNAIGVPYDPDEAGMPQQVYICPPDAVNAHYDADGFLVYDIGNEQYSADEVVHVRVGITIPGEPLTIGVVEAHRRGIEGMLAQQSLARSVWQEGSVPSGVVQLDTMYPTTDQATTVKENWTSIHNGRRTVAVTGKAMTYTPVTWSAKDAEFLESRQFSIAETALMFGLKPEDLGASFGTSSGSLSYGNRNDDALVRITDAYMPVLLPVELMWSRRLLPDGVRMRANPEALMRATPTEALQLEKLRRELDATTAPPVTA